MDVTRLSLSNGLQVVLKEIHTAPLVSHWLWYRVGSRSERIGCTGMSHWVEHLQFRGTPRYPAGVLDREIARRGGYWNASTSLDFTVYYETLPTDQLDLALELEADRMVNSCFDPQDVEAERSVILSERQGNENEPTFLLGEAVQEAAFQRHAYGHDVIGRLEDLQTIQRQGLINFYRQHYLPNNAILTLAGSFDTSQVIQRLEELYASIPSGEVFLPGGESEPEQSEERHLEVSGPGETVFLDISYHAPQASHPDFLPLTVLDSLLSGASSVSFFGGSISNKTSRLYRALVERELAVSVYGNLLATLDPFLYSLNAVVRPEGDAEAVLNAIDNEITRLQDTPPTTDELARAVKQARALFAYSAESVSQQAAWLGLGEVLGEAGWFRGYLERLAQVTPGDVLRIAQTYLRSSNRVVGIYLPIGELSE